MPSTEKDSHPPQGVPDDPEDAEAEESDEYDIEVGCDGFILFLPSWSTRYVVGR